MTFRCIVLWDFGAGIAVGIEDAVEAVPGGSHIRVKLRPAAKTDRFPDGYDAWRNRIVVAVSKPARQGAANAALLNLVGHALSTDVHIVAGASSRSKTLFVAATTETVVRALEVG